MSKYVYDFPYPRYPKIKLNDILTAAIKLFSGTILSFLLTLRVEPFPINEFVKGNIIFWIAGFINYFFPNLEHFALSTSKHSLITKKLFIHKEIILPTSFSLVITRATAVYLMKGNHVYENLELVENSYMVCIVDYITADDVEKIFHKYPQKFQNKNRYRDDALKELLRGNTYCRFLYSFAFNPVVIQTLIQNKKCNIIIPKSLEEKVSLEAFQTEIIVDNEY